MRVNNLPEVATQWNSGATKLNVKVIRQKSRLHGMILRLPADNT